MTCFRAIAATPPIRTDLRLAVLAQWVRAGLALMRGATTTGRGLIGGAVALWRVAQAIRLAMLLAQRLGEIRLGTGSVRPGPDADPDAPRHDLPTNADALRCALAELAATISDALDLAPHRRASVWDREPPGSLLPRVSLEPRRPSRRPLGRRTPAAGRRPHRPPGPRPPRGRQWRSPHASNTTPTPTPIAAPATGRSPLAWA